MSVVRNHLSRMFLCLLALAVASPAIAEDNPHADAARQWHQLADGYANMAKDLDGRMAQYHGDKLAAAMRLLRLYKLGEQAKRRVATAYADNQPQKAKQHEQIYNQDVLPRIEAAKAAFDAAENNDTVVQHTRKPPRLRDRVRENVADRVLEKREAHFPKANDYSDHAGAGETQLTALSAKPEKDPKADRQLAEIQQQADDLRAALRAAQD